MNCGDVRPGLMVQVMKDEGTRGMVIDPRHLSVREVGAVGVVTSYVPGHGGDVWFVQHLDNGNIGAYCFTELEPYDGKIRVSAGRVVEV